MHFNIYKMADTEPRYNTSTYASEAPSESQSLTNIYKQILMVQVSQHHIESAATWVHEKAWLRIAVHTFPQVYSFELICETKKIDDTPSRISCLDKRAEITCVWLKYKVITPESLTAGHISVSAKPTKIINEKITDTIELHCHNIRCLVVVLMSSSL